MKGMMRFGKLSLRYVGPFKITKRVGKLAYWVALPPKLVGMHDIFYVSMLRKYIVNPEHVIEFEPLEIYEELTYEEVPIRIMDRKEQLLRTRRILIVKVL